LVCIENTHNRGGGSVWPLAQIESVVAAARERSLALHLDGARLWNASVASGVSEAKYASCFDTVSVCFSKGLGAPVGSILAGTADVIAKARFFRKQQGGAMRQVGILAAAAAHALEHNRDRLTDDHANCRALANGLARLPGLEVDAAGAETNMLFIGTGERDAAALAKRLDESGIRLLATGPHTLRAVTHLAVTAGEIGQVIAAFEQAP
jgi:threonine aldolase